MSAPWGICFWEELTDRDPVSECAEGQRRQRADDAGNTGDLIVNEFPDILAFLDIDLEQLVVIAAGRIELRDAFGLVDGVGDLVGLAGGALELDEDRLHGNFLHRILLRRIMRETTG